MVAHANHPQNAPESAPMTTHHHTSKTCRHCRDEVRQRNRYGDPLGVTAPGDPRFAFHPIETELARRLGHPAGLKTVYRFFDVAESTALYWRHHGLTLDQADRLACRLGHHPADLWPNYWDIPFRGCTTRPDPKLEEAAA